MKLALRSLFACFNDIIERMAANFLHLNESKTRVIMFGPLSVSEPIINQLGSFKSKVHNHAKSLGVIFDAELKFDLGIIMKEYSKIETFSIF